jgi:hypothetical protein
MAKGWLRGLGIGLETLGDAGMAYGQGAYQRGREQTDDAMRAYDRWIQQNPWRTGEETEAFLESLEQQYKHGDLQATGETARASVPSEEERLLGAAGTKDFIHMSPEMTSMVQGQVGLIDKPLAGPPRPPIQAKAAPGEIPAITTPYTTGPPSQFGGPSLQPPKPELAPTPYADKLGEMQQHMLESQRAAGLEAREQTVLDERALLKVRHESMYGVDGKGGYFREQMDAETDGLVRRLEQLAPAELKANLDLMREQLFMQENWDYMNWQPQLKRKLEEAREVGAIQAGFNRQNIQSSNQGIFTDEDGTAYMAVFDPISTQVTMKVIPKGPDGELLVPFQNPQERWLYDFINRLDSGGAEGNGIEEPLTRDRVVAALGGGEQTPAVREGTDTTGSLSERYGEMSGGAAPGGAGIEAPGMDDPRNPENQRNFIRINQLAQLIEASDDPMAIQQAVNEILEIDPDMTLPVTREAHSRLQPLPNPTDALEEVAQIDAKIERLQMLIDAGRISGEAVAQTKAQILELQRARLPFMVPTEPPR